jgi:hypothetical protein
MCRLYDFLTLKSTRQRCWLHSVIYFWSSVMRSMTLPEDTPRTASPGLVLLVHGTHDLVQRMPLALRLFLA